MFQSRIVRTKGKEIVTFSAERNPIFGEGVGVAVVSRTGGVVDISCLEVIRELSNYIDKEVTPKLREQILAHLLGCSRCTAVYDGLKNTVTLIGDGGLLIYPQVSVNACVLGSRENKEPSVL